MGFQQTFRARAFSYGAKLFGIIPIVGDIIGFVYTIVLFIIGIREGHGTSTARAVLAVFFPFIMSAIFLIIALIFIRIFLGSLGMFGGVGI
jgi:hypothetical protein